jgi:protein O-GlcNAc transferase
MLFGSSPASGSRHADQLIAEGNQAEAVGKLHEACEQYRKAVAAAPGYAKAQLNLGVALEAIGNSDSAIEAYEAALANDPANAYASYNLGKLLYTRGTLSRAEELLHSALKHKPEFPEAHVVLASLYEAQGKLGAAAAALEVALHQRPDWPGALCNYAVILKKLGQLDEAEAVLSRDIKVDAGNADAYLGLAMMRQARGELKNAEALFHRALVHNPELLEARIALGGICKDRGDYHGAENCARQVIALKPDHAAAHYCLGDALFNRGDRAKALNAFDRALALNPKYLEARWARTMAHIPMVGGSESEVLSARSEFLRELIGLKKWIGANDVNGGHESVAMIPPFYLAYTEEDNRDLLRRHGELCAQLMGDWLQGLALTVPHRGNRDRIEVGIVSAHVFDHSVWNAIIKGWVTNLDAKRFSLSIFHLGIQCDEETAFARSSVSHFEEGQKSVNEWVRSILSRRPDVLIYAEIGMDPTTLRLASLRLAPVQAATWGHPETTGLPTIDYYLSADLLEPAGADAHYTESLVRLPSLGVHYKPLPVPHADPDLRALGIDGTRTVLLSPGAPFKYSPRHDWVFVEIARRTEDCQLVFFAGRSADITALLHGRLRAAFSAAGLDFDRHVKFIPWLDRANFHGLMKRADVFLDSIGFSGFNTAMQAVDCGLPIVTREGRFMRGRLGSAILDRMELSDLVAKSEEAYIDLAVKLASDAHYRQSVRTRMAQSKATLYNDTEPIRALEAFLADAVRETRIASGGDGGALLNLRTAPVRQEPHPLTCASRKNDA